MQAGSMHASATRGVLGTQGPKGGRMTISGTPLHSRRVSVTPVGRRGPMAIKAQKVWARKGLSWVPPGCQGGWAMQ